MVQRMHQMVEHLDSNRDNLPGELLSLSQCVICYTLRHRSLNGSFFFFVRGIIFLALCSLHESCSYYPGSFPQWVKLSKNDLSILRIPPHPQLYAQLPQRYRFHGWNSTCLGSSWPYPTFNRDAWRTNGSCIRSNAHQTHYHRPGMTPHIAITHHQKLWSKSSIYTRFFKKKLVLLPCWS